MNGFFLKSLCDYLATGGTGSASRAPRGVSPYAEALDESLAEHDKHFHGGNFDPNTMSCSKRDEKSKFDNSDNLDVKNAKPSSRITPEEDADYADAVKRGDKETALRMIREAAAKAMPDTKVVDEDGLPLVVYHGTNSRFNTFGKSDIGIWFADSVDAEGYAERETKSNGGNKNLIGAIINLANPLDVGNLEGVEGFTEEDSKHYANLFGVDVRVIEDIRANSIADEFDPLVFTVTNTKEFIDLAQKAGYDGLVGFERDDEDSVVYCVFDPSQIKSADITYDDKGNLIPLSERFDSGNDIRGNVNFKKKSAWEKKTEWLASDEVREKALKAMKDNEAEGNAILSDPSKTPKNFSDWRKDLMRKTFGSTPQPLYDFPDKWLPLFINKPNHNVVQCDDGWLVDHDLFHHPNDITENEYGMCEKLLADPDAVYSDRTPVLDADGKPVGVHDKLVFVQKLNDTGSKTLQLVVELKNGIVLHTTICKGKKPQSRFVKTWERGEALPK